MLRKVISGGQTGVDRAALDAALECGLEIGGWCPRERRAEDGVIPTRYPLRETPKRHYAQRTEWNVRDSDATLILCRGELRGGTARTRDYAQAAGKPCRVVDLNQPPDVRAVLDWLDMQCVETLNVAGPRESQAPGTYEEARAYLLTLFRQLRA